MDVKKSNSLWDSVKKTGNDALDWYREEGTSIYNPDGSLKPGGHPTERLDPNKTKINDDYMKKIGG